MKLKDLIAAKYGTQIDLESRLQIKNSKRLSEKVIKII